jgi:hypothetical protein
MSNTVKFMRASYIQFQQIYILCSTFWTSYRSLNLTFLSIFLQENRPFLFHCILGSYILFFLGKFTVKFSQSLNGCNPAIKLVENLNNSTGKFITILKKQHISIDDFKVKVMVFNTTFNNISFISWWSILLMKETGVPGQNHWPAGSQWQTFLRNVVSSTSHHSEIWTHNFSGDRHWLHTTSSKKIKNRMARNQDNVSWVEWNLYLWTVI